jgi:hypothetical protein
VILNPYFLTQPASLLRNAGESATFSASAAGLAPLQYRWRKDGVLLAGATASSLTLTNLQTADAGNYDLIVSNFHGAVTSLVAALTINDAWVDAFNPSASGPVRTLIPTLDGNYVAGGQFFTLAGVSRSYLGRLKADGTLDPSFTPTVNGGITCVAEQPDGKLLIGGSFTTVNGQSRTALARLNTDGSLDAAFNPNIVGSGALLNCVAPATRWRDCHWGRGLFNGRWAVAREPGPAAPGWQLGYQFYRRSR